MDPTKPPVKKRRLAWITLTLYLGYGAFYLLNRGSSDFRQYQHKAVQVEAKLSLAAITAGEAAYRADNQHFSEDLLKIGYVPEGNTTYVVGFSEKCRKGQEILNSLQIPATKGSFSWKFNDADRERIQKAFSELPCPSDFPTHYEAYAIGSLGGDQLDIWKIDDLKQMANVTNGIPHPGWNIRASQIVITIVILGILLGFARIWYWIFNSRKSVIAQVLLSAGMLVITLFFFGFATLLQVNF